MNNLERIRLFLTDRESRFTLLNRMGIYAHMPDEKFLKKAYKIRTGKELNLESPQSFNEKIQWMKLYDRKPQYTKLVDKYEVKKIVAGLIGDEYIIPTYGVWDSFDEIDFDSLPRKFVLKCTHDSGGIVIVRDKNKFDIRAARKKITKRLKRNYYYTGREWPYKGVRPRIIAEQFLEDAGHAVPKDYKVYCFNGKPSYIVVFHNRFSDTDRPSETVYDTEWNKQEISFDEHFPISGIIEEKPECLEELLAVCGQLCRGFSQVRIDFYIQDKKIYFGEITLHTASGFQPMIPKETDDVLGRKVKLL